MGAALRTLKLPGFRNLALAYAVNELGDWLGLIALAVLVFDQTGDPLATTALFLATQFLPALLVPLLVPRLEAHRVRRTLAGLYLGEAVLVTALAVLAGDFVLGAVIALAAVDGALAGSARALTRAASGSILKPAGLLREGNAVLNIAFTAGAALGPALGGLVVVSAGVQAALLVDAASFVCVAVVVAVARGIPQAALETSSWLGRLRNGIRYVRERPILRRLLGAQAAAFVFFAVVIPIEVVFASETLGEGDGGYAALLASWGAGMVAGSIAFAVLRRLSLWALLGFGTLAIGVAYLATAFAPSLIVACAASVIGGAGNGVQWVSLMSLLQERVGPAYEARVLSLLEAIASAMPGLGFVIGGAVAAVVSPRASYAVAGAGVLAILAVVAFILRRSESRGELDEAPIGLPPLTAKATTARTAPGG